MNVNATMPDIGVFGHPSCPERFRESLRALPEAGPAAVMLPPVTPTVETELHGLLRRLADKPEVEFSVNDWGTLRRCALMKRRGEMKASLTLGALLAGQDTDPILARFCEPQPPRTVMVTEGEAAVVKQAVWAPPSDDLLRHWRTPSAFEWVPFLKAQGVTRIELCAQPLPLPSEGPGLPVTLIREAIVSVAPCTGRCANCRGPAIQRGDAVLRREANLYLVDMSAEVPEWVDRVVSVREMNG